MRTNSFFLRTEFIKGHKHRIVAAVDESFDYRPTLTLSALPADSNLSVTIGSNFEKDVPSGTDEAAVPWEPLESPL